MTQNYRIVLVDFYTRESKGTYVKVEINESGTVVVRIDALKEEADIFSLKEAALYMFALSQSRESFQIEEVGSGE